ncbi:MAG: radical SAM family heme chaperone HemW [Betaproteobacteria bacterium]|nr:radical SAM family heme chaperone HemW [Betaproteobacteria bacterium]
MRAEPASEATDFPSTCALALYVHVPWCLRKCPYCDFNSHEAGGAIPEARYVEALQADLQAALPLVSGREVRSIFFGGGTPSLLSVPAVGNLLDAVSAVLPLESGCEITLEANPGAADETKFRGFREVGVTRLSLGVQSFDDARLAAIGRVHDGEAARRALDGALRHFERVNVDLMYALPGQTVAQAAGDMRIAIERGPAHLSAYQLTIEPNTWFAHQRPELPGEDAATEMQETLEAMLGEAGYAHYETSAFARPQAACRHNLNYWHFGDYLGIGPGAHSKLSADGRIVRQTRHRQPKAYIEGARRGHAVHEEQVVATADLGFEFMMNALRLTAGFPVGLFRERTGLELAAVEEPLRAAEARGLIERPPGCIRPTRLGRRFLNDLLQLFLP